MASADVSESVGDETGTKIALSGTNGEIVQPDNSEPQLKKEIPPENEVHSNDPNGSPESVPKPKLSSEDYLEKFKLNIIFEELIFRTLDSTPENPLKFLLTSLETMERDNWEPTESKPEKSEAVAKMFKIPSQDTDTAGKTNVVKVRPSSGPATKGPANTKVGTSQVKTTGLKTSPPRPGAASKTVSSKSTPVRPTQPKVAAKTTPTPAKTTVPSTAKAPTGTGPVKTVGAKTGVTGAAGKTGSGGSVAAKSSTVCATGKTTGAKTGTGTKTGPNTSVNKPGSTRPVSAPIKTAVKTPSATGAKIPAKTGATRTTNPGARATGKGPVTRPGAKTGPTQPKSKTPGSVPRTISGSSGKQETEAEPVLKTPSPVEELKEPTPEEPTPEEPVEPKVPEDDGVCSKIPGSEEPEPEELDAEALIALEDVPNNSDDENIDVVHKSPSVDSQSKESLLEPEVLLVAERADTYMTSQDYANDLQAIEDDVDQNRQSDDEGIEVNQELSNDPIGRLRTAEETDNPGLGNLSLDPKGYSELTQANDNVEIVIVCKEELDLISTDSQIPGEKNIIDVDFDDGDSPKEKPHDFQQEILITEQPHDLIETLEEVHAPVDTTDTREPKYSEDLGIDVDEQVSPKDSPVPGGVIDIVIEDTSAQPQAEPDSTTDEIIKISPPSPDLVESSLPDVTQENADNVSDNSDELIEPLHQQTGDLIEPLHQQTGDLIEPLHQQTGDLIEPMQQQTGDLIEPMQQQTGDLIEPMQQQTGDLIDPMQQQTGYLIDPMQQQTGDLTDPMQQQTGYLIDSLQQQKTGDLIDPLQQEYDPLIGLLQKEKDPLIDPFHSKAQVESVLQGQMNRNSPSPDTSEAPQVQFEPDRIFPPSTGDDQ